MSGEKVNPAPVQGTGSSTSQSQLASMGCEVLSSVTETPAARVPRSQRINPDSIQALWFTVGLVGFLVATSFMVSFAGLTEVAAWVGLPVWMRWTVPAFIDVAILAYSLAVLIHRSRGEKTWPSWVSLGLFTCVSVIANAAHALSVEHSILWQALIGAGLAALAPIGVFAATEELGRLVVEQPVTMPRANGEPAVAGPVVPASVEPPRIEPDPEDDPEPPQDPEPSPDPSPEPNPIKTEESPAAPVAAAEAQDRTPVEERTPVFEEITAARNALDVEAPVLSVVEPTTALGPNVSDFDQLTRWVVARVNEGQVPSAKDAALLLGVSDRTARRKLAALREEKPQIFVAAARKQA